MTTIKKCVTITEDMWQFVRKNAISLSKFLQIKLEEEMKKKK